MTRSPRTTPPTRSLGLETHFSEPLVKLTRFGILARTVHAEVPPRVEYHLTPFGERFIQIPDEVETLRHEFE
ncbi:MAG: winged helix-turn-helix transcriptional regulator [Planctomycetota bacterium]